MAAVLKHVLPPSESRIRVCAGKDSEFAIGSVGNAQIQLAFARDKRSAALAGPHVPSYFHHSAMVSRVESALVRRSAWF
jgi:hypothetical protein